MPFDILLLNPPRKGSRGYNREGRCTQEAGFWATPWPPYSLAMTAAVLRKDHAVRILDCPAQRVSEKKLSELAQRTAPDIIIASISTETVEGDLEVLARIKGLPKKPIVVIFGVHASVFADEILADGVVDFVVRGEPERTVENLMSALSTGVDVRGVKGISGRDADGRIFSTEDREFIEDLDVLPFPAWDLIDLDRYTLPVSRRRFLMINTSRGCPFACAFCTARAYYGSAARPRSSSRIIAEIRSDLERFAVRDFFFWSDTFTLVRSRVEGLCRAILAGGLKVRWVANSRVDTVDADLLALMKKSGCWMISYGLESGDDRILEASGKKITAEQIERTVRATKAAGIKTAGHFIFGLPGETERTAAATLVLAKKLDLDLAHFYAAVPYPGSPLFEQASREGWIRGRPWNRFSQSEFVMDQPGISAAALFKMWRRAYRAFYLRPKTLATALSQVSPVTWLAHHGRAFGKFFRRLP